jgi:hypothetical protein
LGRAPFDALRFGITFAPPLVLLFWAGSYLRNLWDVLLAPGVPVEATWESPQGPITLRADSYRIDPGLTSVTLTRGRLVLPSQKSLASVERVELSGLNLSQMASSSLHIYAEGLTANVVREPDGTLQISRYLPKGPSQPAPFPFEVRLTTASIRYEDRHRGSPWIRTVNVGELRVAGAGRDVVGSTDLAVSGIGSAELQFRTGAAGALAARLNGNHLEVGELLQQIRPELPGSIRTYFPNRVGSLRLSGPVDVASGCGKPFRLLGKFELSGRDLAFEPRLGLESIGQAEGTMSLSEHGLSARVQAQARAARFGGAVGLDWSRGFRLAAGGTGQLAGEDGLPPSVRRLLPKPAKFGSTQFATGVSLEPNKMSFEARGTVGDASLGKDHLTRAAWEVGLTDSAWTLRLNRATWGQTPVSGEAWLTGGSAPSLHGFVRSETKELPRIMARLGIKPAKDFKVSGHIRAVGLLGGTLKSPNLAFQAEGSGVTKLAKEPEIQIGELYGRCRLNDGRLEVARLAAKADSGTLIGFGSVRLAQKSLDFQLDGRGFGIHRFVPEAKGLASGAGRLYGVWSAPRFKGTAELDNAHFSDQDLSLARADVELTPRQLIAEHLQVVTGTSIAEGWVSMNLKDQALDGFVAAPEVQLADFLGPDVDGLANVQTELISGTLTDPDIKVRALASNIQAGELPMQLAVANVGLKGDKLTVGSSGVSLLGGGLSATGEYDLKRREGGFDVTVRSLEVARTLPFWSADSGTDLKGRVDGGLHLSLGPERWDSTGKGTLAGFALNGSELGQGVWSGSVTAPVGNQGAADWKKLVATGSAQLAHGTAFVSLEDGSYSAESKRLSGDLIASDFSINDSVKAALPYLGSLSDDEQYRLSTGDGRLTLDAHLAGTTDVPALEVRRLNATGLSLSGIKLGSLAAVGSRTGGTWQLSKFDYLDGPTRASVHGTWTDGGAVVADGELSNLNLEKLTQAVPELFAMKGSASASVAMTGTSEKPVFRGSLNLTTPRGDSKEDALGLELERILVSDGSATASGRVNGLGFLGDVTFTAPVEYHGRPLAETPISGLVKLVPRTLSTFDGLPSSLDPGRIDGAVSGQVALAGSFARPELSGDVAIAAKRLGFRVQDPNKPTEWIPLRTELLDGQVNVSLKGQNLTASVKGVGSRGGSVNASASATIPPLPDLFGEGRTGIDKLLGTELVAALNLENLRLDENNRVITASGEVTGQLKSTGALREPSLAGEFQVRDLVSSVPNLTPSEGSPGALSVDPRFNVNLRLSNPATVKTSGAVVTLAGGARLNGSLSNPDFRAGLSVQKGTLQLPGGKVLLTQGGRLVGTLNREPDGIVRAHFNVDVTGESHVVAAKSAEEITPYDVTITIHGDLLDPDRVTFSTTSVPPGLDNSDVLGLLGRTDILTALGAQTGPNRNDRLQNAITSYALPTLTSGITNEIANTLRLDYLSLEFNAFNQTLVFAGKSLPGGFSLYAQRQISAPTPGYPALYDYRINYRPPVSRVVPRRVSFFIGTDQQRPWKIGLTYSFRL